MYMKTDEFKSNSVASTPSIRTIYVIETHTLYTHSVYEIRVFIQLCGKTHEQRYVHRIEWYQRLCWRHCEFSYHFRTPNLIT